MKLRLMLLLIVVAGGGSLTFALLGCGKPVGPDTAAEAKKKALQVTDDKTPAKHVEEKKTGEQPAATGEFRLPDDPGGRLIARVLAPPEFLPPQRQKTLRTKSTPRAIDNPRLPLPQQTASLLRLNEGKPRRPLQPQLIAPEPLFGMEESFGSLPQSPSFPALDRAKIVTPDVALPVSLDRMAQPVAEKGATTDPTLDASKAAVLAEPLPSRNEPVPFLKLVLPDPFENQETVRLPATEPETLPGGTVSPPR